MTISNEMPQCNAAQHIHTQPKVLISSITQQIENSHRSLHQIEPDPDANNLQNLRRKTFGSNIR